MAKEGKTGSENVVSDVKVNASNGKVTKRIQKKRERDDANGEAKIASPSMPKLAAACSDFKEKALPLSEKEDTVARKRVVTVENEIAAIGLTTGHDDPRPNRRLLDFILHDVEGKAQPAAVELLEVTDLFISGVVLPLEPSGDPIKDEGVRCEGFGQVEAWAISGYEDGSPTVWLRLKSSSFHGRSSFTTS